MKKGLTLLLLLFPLSFEGHVNQVVGAGLVPAPLFINDGGQGQALPLQNYSSQEFLLATLNPDGVNRVAQRRRRHRPHKSAQKARPRVYGIEVGQDEGGAAAPQAAPPPAPGSNGTTATPKKSAPRIKPPTVMIKPPTE